MNKLSGWLRPKTDSFSTLNTARLLQVNPISPETGTTPHNIVILGKNHPLDLHSFRRKVKVTRRQLQKEVSSGFVPSYSIKFQFH